MHTWGLGHALQSVLVQHHVVQHQELWSQVLSFPPSSSSPCPPLRLRPGVGRLGAAQEVRVHGQNFRFLKGLVGLLHLESLGQDGADEALDQLWEEGVEREGALAQLSMDPALCTAQTERNNIFSCSRCSRTFFFFFAERGEGGGGRVGSVVRALDLG